MTVVLPPMNPHNVAALINLLGFITGAALYAMLLVMVVRAREGAYATSSGGRRLTFSTEGLLLLTASLGLLWNLGALVMYGVRDWHVGTSSPWLDAAVFTALGFLPAVVVHSVLRAGTGMSHQTGAFFITLSAYGLSAVACGMQFYDAIVFGSTPSTAALRTLTFGFSILAVALLLYTRRSSVWKRAVWVVALAVFAVSALHLSQHSAGDAPWWVELSGHHASLPLVLAMLYQDYRFALADIFLKRALALVVLVTVAFGLYVLVVEPLLHTRYVNGDLDPLAVGFLLALWVGTALSYSHLRRAAIWFVDAVVLRRVDYPQLRDELARLAAASENPQEILGQVCDRLAYALTARDVRWLAHEDPGAIPPAIDLAADFLLPSQLVRVTDQDGENHDDARARANHGSGKLRRPVATLLIPTHEAPRYSLVIGELSGGRRLLSDDLALLESVALMLARRIDAVRVTHERCERNLREQEISKLATEAELRALRAQLNPHFLFNALTTISYLIQTAPERALETLMRLTGLLRAVLRVPTGGFVSLGEEIDLIESYLAIEHARFEERLRVVIDVPSDLRGRLIPPLVVQPLVENAIKHGIAPSRTGGGVIVTARLAASSERQDNASALVITIKDTGVGVNDIALAQGRKRGVGLANVERRLECFYGTAAALRFQSQPGQGAVAELRLPLGESFVATEEMTERPAWANVAGG